MCQPSACRSPLGPKPMAVVGASQLRTVPGVSRLGTHPHPSPLTTESSASTANVMMAAVSTGRIRWRHGTPVPSHSQAM